MSNKSKKIISYTRVFSDLFHYGHLQLLEKAKSISDYHICGLFNDDICLKWNGYLIMKFEERKAILQSLSCVDEVLEQTEIDPTRNLKYINSRFKNKKLIYFQGHQKWTGLPGTNYIKSIGGEIITPFYNSSLSIEAFIIVSTVFSHV